MGVQVQAQGDEVDVACALAVAEETALDTITACEKTEE